jgi:hypothetical protein
MNALRAMIAVAVLATVGCNLLEEELHELGRNGHDIGAGGSIGTGGSVGTGGTAGTGGAVATGGSGGTVGGAPACPTGVLKGGACTEADLQVCTKTCGPESVGFKTETCASGVYVEGICQFDPAADDACYKIPTADSPQCPSGTPQAGTPCTIPDCVVCGGSTGYLDSTGTLKVGYCVCAAGSAAPKWSCAATSAWPCPAGNGC